MTNPISDEGLFLALSIYLFSNAHWIGGSVAFFVFWFIAKFQSK